MDLFKPMDSFVRLAKTGSFTVAAARALFRDTVPHAKADPIYLPCTRFEVTDTGRPRPFRPMRLPNRLV
jgi:hypothetical protein